jgi:hypothetical protein
VSKCRSLRNCQAETASPVLTERWSTNEICRALMSTTLRAVCVGPRPVPYANTIGISGQGVRPDLKKSSTISVIDAVKDSTAFSAALDHLPCDVVVSDYVIPRGDYGDGLPLFPLINRRYPNLKIVVLSMLEIPAVALANGYGDALHYEQS